jgi:hypothetical protein
VRFGRQVEDVLRDAERDGLHEGFEFIEVLEARDLLLLEAAHYGILLTEGGVRWPEDRGIKEAELRVGIERRVRQRRAGERQARAGARSKPLERQARLAAGGLQAVRFISDDQIPLLRFGPVRKRAAPQRVVIDDDDERPPGNLGQFELLLGEFPFAGDAADAVVKRNHDQWEIQVPLDLLFPHRHNAQRAGDEHPSRRKGGHDHQGYKRLAQPHQEGKEGGSRAPEETLHCELKGFDLVPPPAEPPHRRHLAGVHLSDRLH